MTALSPQDWQAVLLTLRLATVVTLVLFVLATPLAWWLARSRWRWKGLVTAVVALPLVLPPSVLGFYLLIALGPQGPLGQLTAAVGLAPLPFTFWGLVLASVVYSLPFMVQPLHNAFEAIGDHQLRRFKSDPANKGAIMDRGLWAWTRHPNYFGDSCVWWGLWLVSICGWVSLVTVLSPVLMTYFLVYATGARLAEKHMAGRPGFTEYCSRTSFFIPAPPRSG